MSRKNKADLSLVLVTIGWGASFILSKQVLGELEVFNFLALRFLLAFMIAFVIFIKPMQSINQRTLKYGLGLGVVLFLGFSIQTFGLAFTSVSKSAFITGLSVVLVPILLAVMQQKWPEPKILIGSMTAVLGLGLLTMTGGNLNVNLGDGLTLVSAVFFALHIVGVGAVTSPNASKGMRIQAVPMAILQIGTVGVLSLGLSFITETPKLPQTPSIWFNVVVLALVCTAGAFIVQNVAQQYTTATRTALIYAMEPVFAAVCGYVLLGEILGTSALIGAGLILTGTLISEIPISLSPRKATLDLIEVE
jgi:drug/metabolite transporter (DMT)-like permease